MNGFSCVNSRGFVVGGTDVSVAFTTCCGRFVAGGVVVAEVREGAVVVVGVIAVVVVVVELVDEVVVEVSGTKGAAGRVDGGVVLSGAAVVDVEPTAVYSAEFSFRLTPSSDTDAITPMRPPARTAPMTATTNGACLCNFCIGRKSTPVVSRMA